jgi:hypothetical protein
MMADIPSPVSSFSPTEVAISAISYVPGTSDTPGTATYSYSLLSGPTLQPGMTAYISGMANLANNGAFVIRTATSSSFTVFNPDGATDTRAQAGTGNVIPPQNPQFVVQGQ